MNKKTKAYKIDSRLYFLVILENQYYKDTDPDNYKKAELNTKDSKAIDIKDISNCVASALFDKNQQRYYARSSDVFNMLTINQHIPNKKVSIESILNANLNQYHHQESFNLFEIFLGENYDTYIQKEVKNIKWFIKNQHSGEKL